MGIGHSMGMSMSQSQKQVQRLTCTQRQVVRAVQLQVRMDLIAAVRGEIYEPTAVCPGCKRKLTPLEILRGFNHDPADYTTCCTSCGARFNPKLVTSANGIAMEIPFYCDCQTLAQLGGMENLSPDELSLREPALYRSAIFHYGNLSKAFAAIRLTYPHDEVAEWETKVQPFLGRMADTVIADCTNAKVSRIRALRHKLGIEAYNVWKSLLEAT